MTSQVSFCSKALWQSLGEGEAQGQGADGYRPPLPTSPSPHPCRTGTPPTGPVPVDPGRVLGCLLTPVLTCGLAAAHTPDNSFMGFVSEELNETEKQLVRGGKASNMAVVYGKEASIWKVSVAARGPQGLPPPGSRSLLPPQPGRWETSPLTVRKEVQAAGW